MLKHISAVIALASTALSAHSSSISSIPGGVVDESTGLAWREFSTLADGESQGFRLATDTEVEALVLRSGLRPSNWAGTFASNFYMQDPPKVFAGTGSNSLIDMSNEPATTSPTIVTPTYISGAWTRQDLGLVANTRDTASLFMLAGLWESTILADGCQVIGDTTRLEACKKTASAAMLERPRLIGQVSTTSGAVTDEGRTYQLYLRYRGYREATNQAYTNPATLGYYMVQAVPEPSTPGMVVLGLMGVAIAARRRNGRV